MPKMRDGASPTIYRKIAGLWTVPFRPFVRIYLRTAKWVRTGVWRRLRRFWRFVTADGLFQESLGFLGRLALRFTSPESRTLAIDELLNEPVVVDTPNGPIRFLAHGRSCFGRAKTLMTKEPESMKWIDRMEPGSIFWDIGGNIGNLALYAARRESIKVWSFEPAAVNYYNLVANCELNECGEYVTCLQLGFGLRTEIARLNVSQLMSGHSFSFKDQDRSEKRHQRNMEISAWQAVQVWSLDDFIGHSGVPCPHYIKIDVPGLSFDILQGASKTLSGEDVKEIQIKTSSSPEQKKGRQIKEFLEGHGFQLAYRNFKQRKRGGIVSTIQRDLVFFREGHGASNINGTVK